MVHGALDDSGRKVYKREVKGSDPDLIKRRLNECATHCTCHRTGKAQSLCYKALTRSECMRFCIAYWGLTDKQRQFLVHTMYHNTDADETNFNFTQRRRWYWGSKKMCFQAFCWLLGTSQPTLRKFLGWHQPGQTFTGSGNHMVCRDRPQQKKVNRFFMTLYKSAAEPMPLGQGKKTRAGSIDADIIRDDQPWICQGSQDNHDTKDDDDDGDHWCPDQPTVQCETDLTLAALGLVPGLSVRYLAHVSMLHLYLLFLATEESDEAWGLESGVNDPCPESGVSRPERPSYVTFLTCWKSTWHMYLKLRKKSQHAQCTTCWELLQALKCPKMTLQEKADTAESLKVHYQHQYLDRCLYWAMRLQSRMRQGILCIIIDSMDKCNFAWPRFDFCRMPKSQSVIRPKLCFTASIAHGFCTNLYLAPDTLDHGSNAFCEVLSATLESVYKICKEREWDFPEHLVLQCDNTVSQTKNQYCMVYLAYLVARYKFASTTANFLMVGHTHEDVGHQLCKIMLSTIPGVWSQGVWCL